MQVNNATLITDINDYKKLITHVHLDIPQPETLLDVTEKVIDAIGRDFDIDNNITAEFKDVCKRCLVEDTPNMIFECIFGQILTYYTKTKTNLQSQFTMAPL
jgi:hypothetical protein